MKYSVPAFCQGQQNQKELSDIDDKEFNDLFVPKQANGLLKAVRFFCFMFLLGPIRIVLAILFLIIIVALFHCLHLQGNSSQISKHFEHLFIKLQSQY